MRTVTAVLMSGLAFTVGLLFGLLLHLPAQSLPAGGQFEGHHLARVRRVAGAGPEADLSGVGKGQEGAVDNVGNYADNVDAQSDVIRRGTANQQPGDLRDYRNNGYPGQIPADNGYQEISQGKSPYFGALNKYPSKISDSVVYVNPAGQKLVLNNNVNKSADHGQVTDPRGAQRVLGNPAVHNSGQTAGQVEDGQATRGKLSQPGSGIQFLANGQELDSRTGWAGNDVTRGVFWSKHLEHACPKGFSDDDHTAWQGKVTDGKFIKMIDGCGRMQNRLLTFTNLEKACARYRLNVDQIQGEIYSYYLSKLLGVNNVPPSTLQLAKSDADRWRLVSQEVANAKWSEEKPVILSRWMDDLTPAYIPTEFRNLSVPLYGSDVTGTLSDNKFVNSNTGSSLCELLQWSDLIVFDYLTANLDRVVNNLFNLQWNERMMSKPAHNLETTSNGNLVFLDNESGLFHGYRLLDKYSPYHESLLNTLCIFRERTILKIRSFVETGSIGDALQSLFEKQEPLLYKYVPRIPAKNIKILKQRMSDILNQVEKCESQS